MNDALKRCSRGDSCSHPGGPWLPPTNEYFSKSARAKDGLQDACKACKRAHYLKNREAIRLKHKAYYDENRDRILQRSRDRYADDPQLRAEIQVRNRRWRDAHPDYARESASRRRSLYGRKLSERERESARRRARAWNSVPENKERRRAYLRQNRQRVNDAKRQWVARNRQRVNDAKRQWYYANKEKILPQQREYAARNYARRRSYFQKWYRENPSAVKAAHQRRRARKRQAGGTLLKDDIKRQGESQKWRCWWCGSDCQNTYHVDHRIPLAKGGSNNASNICISCPTCNLSKGPKMPWEWSGRLL